MKALTGELIEAAQKLQRLPALSESILGGGTNLALRYNHRESDDIDLFFPEIIGKDRYEGILRQVKELYPGKILNAEYPCDINDQFMFQRIYLRDKKNILKIEILQNSHTYDQPDLINDLRMMSERDIGLLKLVTAGNRANRKDIYDLDYITERISLPHLMRMLKDRQDQFSLPIHRTIFQLDNEVSPVDDPQLLLKFESPEILDKFRPGHSNPQINHLPGSKNWISARSSWRMKVRAYFREIGVPFPTFNDYGKVENQNLFERDHSNDEDDDQEINHGYSR